MRIMIRISTEFIPSDIGGNKMFNNNKIFIMRSGLLDTTAIGFIILLKTPTWTNFWNSGRMPFSNKLSFNNWTVKTATGRTENSVRLMAKLWENRKKINPPHPNAIFAPNEVLAAYLKRYVKNETVKSSRNLFR